MPVGRILIMPTYDYECPGDGEVIEFTLPFDHEAPLCACGDTMRRVFNAVPVKFNGSGFYSTGG
jgi:putative FmdB family regulatory protein